MSGREPSRDGEWIREAVGHYEERLVLFAARIVGDPVRAQDVVQQTFLQLCRQERDRVEGHLAEWLYTVCKNEAIAVLRKEGRRRAGPIDVETQESDERSPLDALQLDESMSQILDLFGTLSQDQQKVLHLKYTDGLTYREISSATGLPEGSVRSLIHRGLKKLREAHRKLSHETES